MQIDEQGLHFGFSKDESGRFRLSSYGTAHCLFGDGIGSPFCQVQLAGDNRNVHHGCKLYGAQQSEAAQFVSRTDRAFGNGREIVLTSATDKLTIETHFVFFDGVSCARIWNEVRNDSAETICLEEVDSIFLHGLCDSHDARNRIWIPHNSWHTEAQWLSYTLKELGLFNGNGKANMKRISVCNNGTWSTKEFLPMGVLESDGRFVLWQIESNGSWCYELGDCDGLVYLNAGGPNFDNNMWSKALAPGEKYSGAVCALTFGRSLDEVFANITKYRRAIRRENCDNIDLPLIYNSYMHCLWDYPTPDGLSRLIDKAAEYGMEYFCIDAGWHDEDDWFSTIGEWKISNKRFGGDLKSIVDKIRSAGMKVGLWIELECIGVRSKFLETCDESWFLKRNGKPIVQHDRLFLDFTRPQVRARADELIERLVGFGAEYIKIDYNADAGVSADDHGSGLHLSEHCRAYAKWLCGVYEKHPQLVIENCASGGCRMDYVMLALNSIQSTSDQMDYRKYPYISANILSAVTPEQAAVWCYPVGSGVTPEQYASIVASGEKAPLPDVDAITEDDVVINVINGLIGRMHLAGHIELLEGRKDALMKEGLAAYRAMIPTKRNAVPYLPNGFASFGDTFVASGLGDDTVVYLAIWNLGGGLQQSLDLGFVPERTEVFFPSDSAVGWETDGATLRICFTKPLQAVMLRFEKSEEKKAQ